MLNKVRFDVEFCLLQYMSICKKGIAMGCNFPTKVRFDAEYCSTQLFNDFYLLQSLILVDLFR